MKNSASMQFHVNKTAPISLYTDGLEILFRNLSGIPDTDSGNACALPFDCCIARVNVGPVTPDQ